MRCLERARPTFAVDVREVNVPGGGDELTSPYVNEASELDLRAWAHDALVLTVPDQILCREDCAGLCPVCGVNLNEEPDHVHEKEPDPRWAALRGYGCRRRPTPPILRSGVKPPERARLQFSAAHGRPQAEAVALAHDQAPLDPQGPGVADPTSARTATSHAARTGSVAAAATTRAVRSLPSSTATITITES